MFWTFKKSFDVDVEKLGNLFSKNLVTLLVRDKYKENSVSVIFFCITDAPNK